MCCSPAIQVRVSMCVCVYVCVLGWEGNHGNTSTWSQKTQEDYRGSGFYQSYQFSLYKLDLMCHIERCWNKLTSFQALEGSCVFILWTYWSHHVSLRSQDLSPKATLERAQSPVLETCFWGSRNTLRSPDREPRCLGSSGLSFKPSPIEGIVSIGPGAIFLGDRPAVASLWWCTATDIHQASQVTFSVKHPCLVQQILPLSVCLPHRAHKVCGCVSPWKVPCEQGRYSWFTFTSPSLLPPLPAAHTLNLDTWMDEVVSRWSTGESDGQVDTWRWVMDGSLIGGMDDGVTILVCGWCMDNE